MIWNLQVNTCVFIISTYVDGNPPESALWFYKWLEEASNDFRVQKSLLQDLEYAVFGLGNSLYEDNFNRVGACELIFYVTLGNWIFFSKTCNIGTRGDECGWGVNISNSRSGVRGSSLSSRLVSLGKELRSNLSLFAQVYKWVLVTYCWGLTLQWTSILSRGKWQYF